MRGSRGRKAPTIFTNLIAYPLSAAVMISGPGGDFRISRSMIVAILDILFYLSPGTRGRTRDERFILHNDRTPPVHDVKVDTPKMLDLPGWLMRRLFMAGIAWNLRAQPVVLSALDTGPPDVHFPDDAGASRPQPWLRNLHPLRALSRRPSPNGDPRKRPRRNSASVVERTRSSEL